MNIKQSVIAVGALTIFAWAFIDTAMKQEESKNQFINTCLQDKKNYECDFLWSQTDDSKKVRNLVIAAGVGAAAGRSFYTK